MNEVDKIFVVGIGTLSGFGYLYMRQRQRTGKPVSILGLDADNSVKLVAAIGIVCAGLLLIPKLKKAAR